MVAAETCYGRFQAEIIFTTAEATAVTRDDIAGKRKRKRKRKRARKRKKRKKEKEREREKKREREREKKS